MAPYRGFVLACFRKFGIGTSRFEGSIIKESSYLIEALTNLKGKPVDLTWHLNNAVSNIICKVVFGTRFELSDERIHRLLGLLNRHNELLGPARMAILIPMNFPGKKKQLQVLNENIDEILSFINNMIEDHRRNFDPDNLNDLIDMWLNEIRLHRSQDLCSYLNPDNMPGSIWLLFFAGTDTSSHTLRWASQYLVRYPEIQDRVHREIDEVVGRNELPTFSDRLNLPYTRAVLTEVQRIVSLTPFSIHVASDTTTFRGYTIPKGSVVISNLYGVMHSPEVWEDPEAFKPERFLDDKGNFHEPREVIPFGIDECDLQSCSKIISMLCIYYSITIKCHVTCKTHQNF